ncbi:MAG TPA: hypothetical protein VKD72_17925 [Gemmataceae bacterium]|nr:hypothetical protein [Gemmataceae bacterium]
MPGSAVDEIDGHFEIEAAGCSPGLLRTISFARGETDEGLDVAQPIVVEGLLVVVRHPTRGSYPRPRQPVARQPLSPHGA